MDQFKASATATSSATAKFAATLKTVAINMAITFAINAVIKVFTELAKVEEEVKQKAKELGAEFKNTKSDIDSYKKQIEELYKTINDSGSSIEDVTNARKTLMSVQDELIDKFSTEKNAINDITDAINGQVEAFDRLTQRQWQEVKNRYNNSDIWNYINNFIHGYSNNIDRMLNEYGDYSVSINLSAINSIDTNARNDAIKKLIESGYDVDELYLLDGVKGQFIKLSGDATEVYNQLIDIQKILSDDNLFISNTFQNNLDDLINSAEEVSNKYKDFYDQYILYQEILTDNSVYADTFKEITDAYDEYYTAFTSGDEDKIKEATEKYASTVSNAMSTAFENGDKDVAKYFDNMYPALKDKVDKWKFNVAFEANEDGLHHFIELYLDHLKDENGRQLTIEEILGLDKEEFHYQRLNAIATKYNMTLEEMLELLKERNLVADMDYQGLVNLFGQENVDKIAPEDLEIAYKIKNVGNMTFDELLAEIQRVKEEANRKDPVTFSDIFSLKDAENNLNTLGELNDQLNKIQAAYKNLSDAMDTYSSAGYITIDQFQAIVEQGSQFLDYLELEDGQLSLNEQAMYDLAEARIVEMKAQMLQGIVDNVKKINSEEAAADYLKTTNYELAESYNVLAEAQIKFWALTSDLSQETKDAVVNKAIGDINKINALVASIDLSSIGSKSASSAAKSFTDLLDKELNALDKKIEAGYIDFKDYIQARLDLIEDYYRQGKISADEYYSYLNKHYDTQLSYMDKVVNAVTRRIDKEIDGLEKQKDSVDDYYNLQIKSLEKEKTLLEEANNERQRQIDLQKALYEMERARNQHSILQYSSEKGMHYVADDKAIREAQEDVDQSKYEIRISEIEKSISALEEARDKETDTIQEMIDRLEDYKDAWKDITSAYAEAQEDLLAAQFFGANWETDILDGRLDILNDFKNQYISLQQAMADAAWQSANEQIKAAKEAEKGASGKISDSPIIDDNSNNRDLKSSWRNRESIIQKDINISWRNRGSVTQIKKYASGTNNAQRGLNLVGEDGEELYFDNDGHVAIVTKPTLIPMEGGEIVKNEQDTKKLLDSNNLAPVDTIGLADIDGKEAEYTIKVNIETNGELPDVKNITQPNDGSITLADGTVLTPLHTSDKMFDLQHKFNDYITKLGGDISSITAPISSIQKDMERMVNSLSTVSNFSNNTQQVNIGDINITCTGVTSQEVMKQVGDALNKQFSGMALDALQQSKIR